MPRADHFSIKLQYNHIFHSTEFGTGSIFNYLISNETLKKNSVPEFHITQLLYVDKAIREMHITDMDDLSQH